MRIISHMTKMCLPEHGRTTQFRTGTEQKLLHGKMTGIGKRSLHGVGLIHGFRREIFP